MDSLIFLSFHFSELSITEVSTPASVAPSSDATSPTSLVFTQAVTAPKTLSYAQMAQKPNSNNKDMINIEVGPEAKDISDASLESKKVDTKPTSGNQSSGKAPQRKPSGGKNSPRSQRRRPSEKTENGELVPSSMTSTSPVLKETYASKFGSSSSSSDSNKQTTNISRPKTAASTNNSNTAAKGSANSNKGNLPPPRPLMSQVINPPVSKLDEVNGLQLQQQPISFSDTVKKTNTTSASHEPCMTPTSPKSVDIPAVDSVSAAGTSVIPDTLDEEKEKS